VRQHQIKNDGIKSFPRRQRESGFAVGCRLHDVTFPRQPIVQRYNETIFIFDEENFLFRHRWED
jgi:hypothetical protein